MLVKIEARILIFPSTDFHFPSTSVPPGTFLRLCTYHSVTYHPAEATVPPLPQTKLVLNTVTPEGCKVELTIVGWLNIDMVYLPEDSHPSQY